MKQNKGGEAKGRSMIEMLGTLAIVGVLTMLVIKGFRYAWDTNDANDIVSTVTKMAVTASTQLETSGSANLSEFDGDMRYETAVNLTYGDELFSITVKDVSYGVCTRVKSYHWPDPVEVKYGGAVDGECPDEDSDIEFAFKKDLSRKTEK